MQVEVKENYERADVARSLLVFLLSTALSWIETFLCPEFKVRGPMSQAYWLLMELQAFAALPAAWLDTPKPKQ